MGKFAVFLLALLALVSVVVAEVPSLEYNIDFREFSPQYEVQSAIRNTPLLKFRPKLGTNTYSGAGYTYVYRFGKTQSADAMTSITGSWNNGVIEFQVGSNDFPVTMFRWYSAVVAMSNQIVVSFARGRQTIVNAPEVDSPGTLAQTTNINGSGYSFTGSFVGWPFPIESGSISQFTGEAATSGLVWTASGPGLPGFWGPGGSGSVTSVSGHTNVISSNAAVIIYFASSGQPVFELSLTSLVAQLAAQGVIVTSSAAALPEADPVFTASVAWRVTAADTNFWTTNFTPLARYIATSAWLNARLAAMDTNFASQLNFSSLSGSVASLVSGVMMRGSNGSDIANAATFRSNLGLGSAATNAFTNAIWNASQIANRSVSSSNPSSGQIFITASALGPWTPRTPYGAATISTDGEITLGTGVVLLANVDTNSLDAVFAKDTELASATSAIYTVLSGKYAVTGGNLSGRATLAAAAQGTNALSVRNTQTPGAGVDVEINSASSDYMLRLSRGTTEEYRFSPTLADFGGNDLVDVGGASFASITSGWFNGDGAGVTNVNAQTLDGTDVTGLTTVARFELLNEAAIVDTNARAQRVLGDLHGASFIADQGVVAACTNCAMSTNMLVNGDFAAGGAYWTFTGGANSNSGSGGQLIVAGNTSGTAVQSNQFSATPGSWQVSWTNTSTDATGSITVAWGGVEVGQVGPLTGYKSWIIGPRTTNGFSISASVTGSTAGAWKNFTLKQIFTGDMTAVYGSFTHLAASNLLVNGLVTPATGTLTVAGDIHTAYGGVFGDLLLSSTNWNLDLNVGASGTAYTYPILRFRNYAPISGNTLNTNYMIYVADGLFFNGALISTSVNVGATATGSITAIDESGRHYGDGSNLTNLDASSFAPGGVFPAMDGSALTGIVAATTGGLNAVVLDVTNSLTGTVDFDDSAEINAYQNGSNGASWQIVSGSIVSSKLASAVWDVIEARYAAKIGTSNDSVTTAHIQGGAIGNAEMAASAVAQSNIVANSIGASRMMATNAHAAGYVLKSSDSNTFYWAADATGGGGAIGMGPTNVISGSFTQIYYTAGFKFMSTGEIAWLENVAAGGGGITLTNAFTPTALIAGAGDTVTVTTASGPLLYFQPTANVNRLTFDSSWSSSQVGLVTIDIYAGPYSITWDTNAITNTVYLTISTNVGVATPVSFRKAHGQTQWKSRNL